MSRPSTEERLAAIHTAAVAQFDDINAALREERLKCLSDRRFYSIEGAQWEGDLEEQFANKPKLEVNKIHLAVLRIINEYRNNRISVKFTTKDGSKQPELADTCAGLFRADEHDSVAEEAYDNAFEEAVGGGFGAIRLRAVYEDEEDAEDERQRIKIEPIYDADTSVFFDLDAKRQDKSDARFCFVLTSMTVDKYKDEWGDDPSTWDKALTNTQFDWAPPDVVYVAEYYLVEDQGDTIITFQGITSADVVKVKKSVLTQEREDELTAQGYQRAGERKIKSKRVHKYILSGSSVLKDEGYVAGKCIPVVPTYGKRWFVDNVERCMGHVRLAKDAQRLKNMQLSKLAEMSAQSAVEKPILTPEQIAGHEDEWSDDSITNYPYLLVNPVTDVDGNPMPAAPLGYTHPPMVPPVLSALLGLTDMDIKDLLGAPQEDKMVSNIAERTFISMRVSMDMQTLIYLSNFAKAIHRVGEVWLSMASELYVEDDREMKSIDATDQVSVVKLNSPISDPATGAMTKAADLSSAKMDVAVDVGPSSESRREAIVKALTGVLQATQATQDPETAQVVMAMIMLNMEGEGIGDVRDFFRQKLIKMGVMKPRTDDEKQMLIALSQQTSSQDKALESMADESEAKATKARAEVLQVMANVEKIRAETMKILDDTNMSAVQKVTAMMQMIQSPAVPPQAQLDQAAAQPGASTQG